MSRRRIRLSNRMYAIVSAEDYEHLKQFSWIGRSNRPKGYPGKHNFYCYRWTPRKNYKRRAVYMHHEVSGSIEVDHIDGNGLHNYRENLRPANHNQNQHNKGKCYTNTTGYKGVRFDKRRGSYYASIMLNKKTVYIGAYKTAKKAALAYRKKAIELHQGFARW